MPDLTPHKSRAGKLFAQFGLLMYVYLLLVLLDFGLYRWGSHLPLPKESQDLMTSWGAFDYTRNPQYRGWIKGFVHTPNQPYKYTFTGDIARVLDIPPSGPALEIELPADELGFINRRSIAESEILIIGDSFVRSMGCQADQTIPAYFEQLSGKKTYAASFPGYGLAHYLEIFRHLTIGAPDENQRFRGKDAYVFVYSGNDLKGNMDDFLWRQADEVEPKYPRHLKLYCLRKLLYLGKLKITQIQNGGGVDNKKTPQATNQEELSRTSGYFPHTIDVPSYRNVLFAFDPYMAQYRRLTWLDDQRKKAITDIFQSFREISDLTNIRLRFVLIPVSVQVLGDKILMPGYPSELEFHKYLPLAIRNYDYLDDYIRSIALDKGFHVVDLKPTLRSQIAHKQLYWPLDTHLTPEGNRLAAETAIKMTLD